MGDAGTQLRAAQNACADAIDAIVVADFPSVLRDGGTWQTLAFPLPDGSIWRYREPDAVVVVQDGRLRVAVMPLTRHHDSNQILDNAKNMYLSARRFEVPAGGTAQVAFAMGARGYLTRDDDLYDGFASLNLLDFATGVALDVFAANQRWSPVYARLPFPGVTVGDVPGAKYFCLFDERDLPGAPGALHQYAMRYDQGTDELRWYLDGACVWQQRDVPVKIEGFQIGLGLMTEKDIGPAGSTSLHGQGLRGEWSPIEVVLAPAGIELSPPTR